jgi:glycosyltransferase involved in cell wall biosynthesis
LKEGDYLSLINKPLVSVIVRTYKRPQVLRETLQSLRDQTYKEFEVILIEDGPNTAEDMIINEFKDLSIVYHAFGENKGRTKAGNFGLELAKGKYINFLDDDDLFLPNHLEILVQSLQNNRNYQVAYSIAYRIPTKITSINPYKYKEKRPIIEKQPFNRAFLFQSNYFPIQSILFERSIYLDEGGFDEELDYFEDWDLWVRYSLKNDFLFVPEITSKYRTPYEKKEAAQRDAKFDDAMSGIREKQKSYTLTISPYSIGQDAQNLYNSFAFKVTYNRINNLPNILKSVILGGFNIIKKVLK